MLFLSLLSLRYISHVGIKKWPYSHVEFKGKDPRSWPDTISLAVVWVLLASDATPAVAWKSRGCRVEPVVTRAREMSYDVGVGGRHRETPGGTFKEDR